MPKKQKSTPIAVIDTNILISYFFGGSTIAAVIDAVERNAYIPALSPYLEEEFVDTLHKPKIARHVDISDALAFMEDWKNFALYVRPRHIVTICRDHKDNAILACALEAAANYIVTGDKDLLVLKKFQGIRIAKPADFLTNIRP